MHFWVAVRRTYSKGERDLGKDSGRVEGWISRFGRPICASSCLRRGEAEARITRFERRALRMGRLRGRGPRGGGGFETGEGCGMGAEGS